MDNSLWVKMHGGTTHFPIALVMASALFGLSALLQSGKSMDSEREASTNPASRKTEAPSDGGAKKGYQLFEHNCAHCHGDDGAGDEGPDLHGMRKSDARLTTIIKGGIKGEMPAFAKKFNDAEVQALITYLRTLTN